MYQSVVSRGRPTALQLCETESKLESFRAQYFQYETVKQYDGIIGTLVYSYRTEIIEENECVLKFEMKKYRFYHFSFERIQRNPLLEHSFCRSRDIEATLV